MLESFKYDLSTEDKDIVSTKANLTTVFPDGSELSERELIPIFSSFAITAKDEVPVGYVELLTGFESVDVNQMAEEYLEQMTIYEIKSDPAVIDEAIKALRYYEFSTTGTSRLIKSIRVLATTPFEKKEFKRYTDELGKILANSGDIRYEKDISNRHSKIFTETVYRFLMGTTTDNCETWFGDLDSLNWIKYCSALRDYIALEAYNKPLGLFEKTVIMDTIGVMGRQYLLHNFPLETLRPFDVK